MRWMMAGVVAAGLAGCASDGSACEIGCEGDVFVDCVDGERVEEDCAAEGQICHEEMLHCMAPA